MKTMLGLTASFAALALAAPAFADDHMSEGRAPMSALDLVTMPRLGSPVVSGNGRYAVYTVTTTDDDTLARRTTPYLRDLNDLDADPVMLDLSGDAWSFSFGADDWLYFLSDMVVGEEDESYARVWRVALEANGNVTGPVLVLDPGNAIDGYKLSPDAKNIAVWAEIARDCEKFGCDSDGEGGLPGPGTGRLYDGSEGFYRHWDQWETPGTFSRAFVFGLEDGEAVGDAYALDGPADESPITGDTPTKPFGGGEDVAWAADSAGVWFVARQADGQEPHSTNTDIWWNDLSGALPVNVTEANEAFDLSPVPSPDGKYLAYLAMARPKYEADKQVIHLRDLATGQTRALTGDFDRSFGSIAWTPDSQWIVASAQDVLDTPVFRISPTSGTVEKLDLMAGNEAHIGNILPLPGGRMLFTRDAISSPAELYLSSNWQQARPLTSVGAPILGARASVRTTRFSFAGAGGDTVWGQITKLEGHDGAMPAILYVHGGPQGSFNDGWSSRWNPRVVASQGYAVISVDFHGSTGYGQAFTDSINRDWGGKPLEDLQKGLSAALALDPQIDGKNVCAMGASYGGYMMNWIAGQWPDRFKCLVQHDGLFDMRSFYYATEELWFPKWDFGGSYSEQKELYEKWNPVNHVDSWQTPMLVITGEKDYRVPYTQGLQSFTALQEREIPSQLLVFPDENHWVLKPKNSLQWHNTVFDWLGRWLKEESGAE
uniref:dipeptidyl-peptidase 5 n=1 Tax=Parerythrobacter lutipelagi TaxID=1964208 RepID=UPI0010F4A177|nr:S9 family peptidase [Parerythrobacter lutipelagi]